MTNTSRKVVAIDVGNMPSNDVSHLFDEIRRLSVAGCELLEDESSDGDDELLKRDLPR